jgi:uncharacterized protein YuzE
MNLKYYKDEDILVIKTSDKPYDHAEMVNNVVVHFTEKGEPVRIEILNATQFFEAQSKILPQEVKTKIFNS